MLRDLGSENEVEQPNLFGPVGVLVLIVHFIELLEDLGEHLVAGFGHTLAEGVYQNHAVPAAGLLVGLLEVLLHEVLWLAFEELAVLLRDFDVGQEQVLEQLDQTFSHYLLHLRVADQGLVVHDHVLN